MDLAKALVMLVADSAKKVGVAENTYIVGGSVRDRILGHEVKDIDVVVEDPSGQSALTLAKEVAGRVGVHAVHPDQYGVVHVGPFPKGAKYVGFDLSGQKIEIVTARSEKYDKSLKTGSHKPTTVQAGTIEEDLRRRDFTINTLMWRLSDVPEGQGWSFYMIPTIDRLGGLADLQDQTLRCPLDPRETFSEDPSRILRAVRFKWKYRFDYEPSMEAALRSMADEMRRLPHELLDGVLCEKILKMSFPKVQAALNEMEEFGLLQVCLERIPETRLRRVADSFEDINMQLLLLRFRFPSSLMKLSKAHRQWLIDAEPHLDSAGLTIIRDRFLKPPLNTLLLMEETHIRGAAVGYAVEMARTILLVDPYTSPEDLYKQVKEQILHPR